jgi:DNA polymerase elongation subunit (family B)
MRLLTIDIETRPNLAWVWGLWNQNVGANQIAESTEMICFSAKWVGKHKVHFYSVHHHGKDEMLKALWSLLDEADAVIHYNGRSFDIPHINREFLEAEMNPPSPYRQIDLLRAVKRKFRFPSNKLEYVAESLDIGAKLKHEGFDLWRRCMAGEDSAWKLMRQYNINDVALTELLYERIRPWIPNIPSHAAFSQEKVCPACGSKKFQMRGFAYTQQSRYRRYQCQNCGKWFRGTKGTSVEIREVAE